MDPRFGCDNALKCLIANSLTEKSYPSNPTEAHRKNSEGFPGTSPRKWMKIFFCVVESFLYLFKDSPFRQSKVFTAKGKAYDFARHRTVVAVSGFPVCLNSLGSLCLSHQTFIIKNTKLAGSGRASETSGSSNKQNGRENLDCGEKSTTCCQSRAAQDE